MRIPRMVAVLVVGLGLARAASAQQSTFFPIIGQTQNQIIDTRNYALPIAAPMTAQSGWSKLASIFPTGLGRIPFQPSAGGTSTFPTPAQMPNADYLKAFQFYRANQATSTGSTSSSIMSAFGR